MNTKDHEDLLLAMERKIALHQIEIEEAYDTLRALLVEKYGEEGVAKVEAKAWAGEEFVSKAALTAWGYNDNHEADGTDSLD